MTQALPLRKQGGMATQQEGRKVSAVWLSMGALGVWWVAATALSSAS